MMTLELIVASCTYKLTRTKNPNSFCCPDLLKRQSKLLWRLIEHRHNSRGVAHLRHRAWPRLAPFTFLRRDCDAGYIDPQAPVILKGHYMSYSL